MKVVLMNTLIVISGCSGGGKSTLLSALKDRGYSVVAEVGREIVKEQEAKNSGITPWQNPRVFCEMIIERSIDVYHKAKILKEAKNQLVFLDRSLVDCIFGYQTLKIKESHNYDHFLDDLRYYPIVFLTPPWREIFCQDDERKHSLEDSIVEYERLLRAYPQAGYKIIEIPRMSVEERVQFVLDHLSNIMQVEQVDIHRASHPSKIQKSSQNDAHWINEKLTEFNNQKVPFTQNQVDIYFNFHIKNDQGDIIAGINAIMYAWGILFINALYVEEGYRKQGLGLELLKHVEKEAKKSGAYIVLLDTFDFQAKAFYSKAGFEVFGIVKNCPPRHTRYHMLKRLN